MGFLTECRTSVPKKTSHDCISKNRLLHFLLNMEKSNLMNLRKKYELSTQNKCFKGEGQNSQRDGVISFFINIGCCF